MRAHCHGLAHPHPHMMGVGFGRGLGDGHPEKNPFLNMVGEDAAGVFDFEGWDCGGVDGEGGGRGVCVGRSWRSGRWLRRRRRMGWG